MARYGGLPCEVVATSDCKDANSDSIVLVASSLEKLTGCLELYKTVLLAQQKVDSSVGCSVSLIALPLNPPKALVFSPTGPINRDYDDVRRFADAAGAGIQRAITAGSKHPLLVCAPDDTFPKTNLVSLLGALQVLYVPFEIRQDVSSKAKKVEKLLVWCEDAASKDALIKQATAIESGRLVARDIGGSDPERMAAPNVAQYVAGLFQDSPSIKVSVVFDDNTLMQSYPLFSAVNRCAKLVQRHQGRIIKLEYTGAGEVKKTLMLVGKGVTYDTGGADIKAGGHMAGMHRDKCGAATVAGFFQTLDLLKPKNIKVIGTMAMVRNSVGVESYVSDEIITSRAGKRIRVGNTDAEGRMAMADCLCEMKEKAGNEVNPHLFTIATLTGHAIRAMGPKYTIILDNGPAFQTKNAQAVQAAGDQMGDPFEISTIRREDYEFHTGKSEYEDILQCNNEPSSSTARGHQSPAAFLIMTSGLDAHGIDSNQPLKYSHLDIAGSSGPFPGVPTGAPIPALTFMYLLN
ncbi:putative aminopeptidase W07G4.4 [Patiria miniata]|uniref:Cytosol aminopeptidase domain-containing protein n=1 Tax=Patiria miniata TaxID=46514 RepID=A0A914B2T2_PATMI|nr:putative aminopeptidase W07G4.4 [Patiria miniata]